MEGTATPKPPSGDSTAGKVLRRSVPGWSVAGPVLLAGVVTAAVVAAMVWHNDNFRRGIFSRFQHYQLASAQGKAAMIESAFGEVSKDLTALGVNSGPVNESALTAVVERFYNNHKDVVDSVVLLDASGKKLLYCGRQGAFASETPSPAGAANVVDYGSDGVGGAGRSETVVHINLSQWNVGGAKYVLRAAVSVRKLCAKSLSSNVALQQSFLGLINRRGDFIYKMDLGNASLLSASRRRDERPQVSQADAVTEAMRSIFPRETGVTELATFGADASGVLVAFASVRLGPNRYSLILGTSESEISVPITAYERLTFTLIVALAVLFFAVGYLAYRGAQGNIQMEKERRLAAESANTMKSQFLARMSHEIRTPMNGILGMTELALGTELTSPQRRYLMLAKQSADNLLTIINDILDLSKIEAGKLTLSCETFSLRDCMDSGLAILGLQAKNKGLELTWEVAPAVPDILEGDPGRLRQVLMNLAGNAVKYTPRGSVRVSVEPQPSPAGQVMLHFAVTDTGIGVPADKLQAVFRPFEQLENNPYRKASGTGLGLAISSQLVGLMGGRIWVDSQVGKGSTFHFTACFGEGKGPVPVLAGGDPSLLIGLPVLVVDDKHAFAQDLHKTLASWGMRPTVVDVAAEAIDAVRRAEGADDPYVLVLVQVALEGVDAFTLARDIKQAGGPAVIMIAAAGIRGDLARCRELGLEGYLTGPVTPQVLLEAILSAVVAGMGKDGSPITRHRLRRRRRDLRVLLVEDNPVNQEHAAAVLQKGGHTVLVVEDGMKALEVLAMHRFDLVLMDVQMPEMDGFETTAKIRQTEAASGGHVPIIAMTAYATEADRRKCLETGMDGYVAKPIDIRALMEMIDKVCPETRPMPSSITPASGRDESVAPAASRPPTFALASALERCGGDSVLLEHLVAVFLTNLPATMSDIYKGVVQADGQKVRQAIHKLTGSAGLLGAGSVIEAAEALRQLAASGQLERMHDAYKVLEHEIRRLETSLGSVVKERTP
jgi:signal transduction histidine kinase/DNA-binding response OmpR family regulator/HPt (histidine-containing phosphotransfer) domain-containing protein